MSVRLAEKLFLVLVILSYAVFQRGLHETHGGFIKMLAYTLLAVVEIGTLILFVRHNRLILAMMRRNRLLLLFTLLTLLSTIWSVEKSHTFIYSIHLLLTTILVFYIAGHFTLREFIQLLAISLGILAIFSLVAVQLRPDQALHHGLHEGNWRGIYFHKNGLGREMAIAAVVFLIGAKEKFLPKMLAVAGFLLCTILTFKALAMASLVALVTVLALYPFLRGMRFQFSVKLLIPIVLLLSAGTIAVYLAGNYATVLHLLGKDTTLTGRGLIWLYSWENILQQPLLGYGYNAFWQDTERVTAALHWPSPHAHNNLIELVLDVGIIGTALIGVVIYRSLIRAVSWLYRGHSEAVWFIMIFLLLLLVGFTESGIHWPYNLLWLTFACSVCYLSEPFETVDIPSPPEAA